MGVVMTSNMVAAARAVVVLDEEYQAAKTTAGGRKAAKRLSGALTVWEALTGLPARESLAHAHEVVRVADAWREATPGLDVWRQEVAP
jgi:hypothetical protein